jgi:hypothetical protein
MVLIEISLSFLAVFYFSELIQEKAVGTSNVRLSALLGWAT